MQGEGPYLFNSLPPLAKFLSNNNFSVSYVLGLAKKILDSLLGKEMGIKFESLGEDVH